MLRIGDLFDNLKVWLTAGCFGRSNGRMAGAVLTDPLRTDSALAIYDQADRFIVPGMAQAEGTIADKCDALCAEVQRVCRTHSAPLSLYPWVELQLVQKGLPVILPAIAVCVAEDGQRAVPVGVASAIGCERAECDALLP